MSQKEIKDFYEYSVKKFKESKGEPIDKNHHICFTGFILLPNKSEEKPLLPIQIDSMLPHINFKIGTEM